jgi:uncharacterized protein HemX
MKTESTKSGDAGKTAEPKSKKQQSTTSEDSKQASGQANQNTMPDWVMHLLTGAGALGGNYLLFIKPLQEKLEAMNKAIQQQDNTIKQLEEQVDLLNYRLKKISLPVDEVKAEPEAEDELFSLGTGHRQVRTNFSNKSKIVRF